MQDSPRTRYASGPAATSSLSGLCAETTLALAKHSLKSLAEIRPDVAEDALFRLAMFQVESALAKLAEERFG